MPKRIARSAKKASITKTPTMTHRRALYDRGYTDVEIAERCRVSRVAITHWRLARDLLPNHNPPNQISPAEERRRLDLYQKGLPDIIIASKVGISSGGVLKWRQQYGLPGHDYNSWRYAERLALWQRGWSDKRIAAKQDVTPGAIRVWRRNHGLEEN